MENVVVGYRGGIDVDAQSARVDMGEQCDVDRRADRRAERVLRAHPGAAQENRHREPGTSLATKST
jgi:hypothetical protein